MKFGVIYVSPTGVYNIFYTTDEIFSDVKDHHQNLDFLTITMISRMEYFVQKLWFERGYGEYFSDEGEMLIFDYIRNFGKIGNYTDVFTGTYIKLDSYLCGAISQEQVSSMRVEVQQ